MHIAPSRRLVYTFARRWILFGVVPLIGVALLFDRSITTILFFALFLLIPLWCLFAYWLVARNQSVDVNGNTVHVKTTDTDISVRVEDISDVVVSTFYLTINTPKHGSSLVIPFVEKEPAAKLYDLHFDAVGLKPRS